ncbi:MAG: hypothetical protein ABIB47_01290 [Candidatus Woesearchaeota archaeon]
MTQEEHKYVGFFKELKTTGVILILLGIAHLFLGALLTEMGIILIVLGIISFINKKPQMFIIYGILLILIGVMNIYSVFLGSSIGWFILALFQVFWGIKEIGYYSKVKDLVPKTKESRKKGFVWYGTRIGFWVVIFGWFVDKIITYTLYEYIFSIFSTIIGIIILVAILFTIIVSIIHLTIYKDKGLAISSLLICSVILILTILASVFLVSLMQYAPIEENLEIEVGTFLPYSMKLNEGEIVHINIESDKNMNFYFMDLENYNLLKGDDKNYEIFVGAGCSQFETKKLDCNWKAYKSGKFYVVLINLEDTVVNANIKLEKIDEENAIIKPIKTQEIQGSTQFLIDKESLKEERNHIDLIKNDIDKLLEISSKYQDLTSVDDSANFISEMTPRLNMHKTHLIEYRNFLNTKNSVIQDKTEYIQKLDDRIVEVDTYINQLNFAMAGQLRGELITWQRNY